MGMIEKVVLLEKCQNRLFIFPFDSAIFSRARLQTMQQVSFLKEQTIIVT